MVTGCPIRWVLLATAGLLSACASASTGGGPEAAEVRVAPEPAATASASAQAETPATPRDETPPEGFVLMEVDQFMDEEGSQEENQAFILLGRHGSMPHYVKKEAAELILALRKGRATAAIRKPYEEWVSRTLGEGGSFVRAEIAARGNNLEKVLVVQRGDAVERVDGGGMTIAVVVLKRIPLFVEIQLIKDVGGWLETPVN